MNKFKGFPSADRQTEEFFKDKNRRVSCKRQSAGSLDTLRDAIIVAHGMAAGNYIQTDTVMRGRIAKHLEKTIRADKTMRDFLEWEENRKFIGIEKDLDYFNIALKRIEEA